MNAQLATPNQRVNLSVRSVTGLANGAGPRRPGPQVTRSVRPRPLCYGADPASERLP